MADPHKGAMRPDAADVRVVLEVERRFAPECDDLVEAVSREAL